MFKPIITSKKYFNSRIALRTCIVTTTIGGIWVYAYLDNVIDSVCPP